jgi:hypothetical protein
MTWEWASTVTVNKSWKLVDDRMFNAAYSALIPSRTVRGAQFQFLMHSGFMLPFVGFQSICSLFRGIGRGRFLSVITARYQRHDKVSIYHTYRGAHLLRSIEGRMYIRRSKMDSCLGTEGPKVGIKNSYKTYG